MIENFKFNLFFDWWGNFNGTELMKPGHLYNRFTVTTFIKYLHLSSVCVTMRTNTIYGIVFIESRPSEASEFCWSREESRKKFQFAGSFPEQESFEVLIGSGRIRFVLFRDMCRGVNPTQHFSSLNGYLFLFFWY